MFFLQDSRFNQEVDAKTGYRTKSLLCMAIKDKRGDVLGVAQVSFQPLIYIFHYGKLSFSFLTAAPPPPSFSFCTAPPPHFPHDIAIPAGVRISFFVPPCPSFFIQKRNFFITMFTYFFPYAYCEICAWPLGFFLWLFHRVAYRLAQRKAFVL